VLSRLFVMAVVLAVAVTACGGDEGGVAATSEEAAVEDLVLAAADAPADTEYVATFHWDLVNAALDEVLPGDAARLEDLGLEAGVFSVFLGGLSDDGRPIDLGEDGLLRVSGALTFPDAGAASAALDVIGEMASRYASGLGATLSETRAPVDGGVALGTPELTGGALALGWVDGSTVRLAFAQGGDAKEAVDGIAAATGRAE
jgi:hypothetical protein